MNLSATVANGENYGYSLTFETTPGGCTVELNGVGTQTTTSGDVGQCIFYNLNAGTYSYTVSKTGYNPKSGSVVLNGDTKVIVILDPDYTGSHIDATLTMSPGPYPPDVVIVTGSISVYNIGIAGSKLDWAITEWPDFGTNWVFDPTGGSDLTPEHGYVLVTVQYERPTDMGSYDGDFVVQNLNNIADKVTLHYILIVSTSDGGHHVTIPGGPLHNPSEIACLLPGQIQQQRSQVDGQQQQIR